MALATSAATRNEQSGTPDAVGSRAQPEGIRQEEDCSRNGFDSLFSICSRSSVPSLWRYPPLRMVTPVSFVELRLAV